MARITLLRNPKNHHAPVPTEPLTPQEWADLGRVVGEQTPPEHLRFHNPAWNLSRLKSIIHRRWEEDGGGGVLREPSPIDTSDLPEADDQINIEDSNVASVQQNAFHMNIEASNILPEGRARKRKAVDYSIFSLPQDNSGGDEDNSLRDKRRNISPALAGINSGSVTPRSSVAPLDQSLDQPSQSAYNGKKRGRPKKIRNENLALSSDISMPQSDDVVMIDSSCQKDMEVRLSPEIISTVQTERRNLLRGAFNKLNETDFPQKLQAVLTEPSAIPDAPVKSSPSYTKRVSLNSGQSQGSQNIIKSVIHQPSNHLHSTESQVHKEVPPLIIPSSPPMGLPRPGDHSPASSIYERVPSPVLTKHSVPVGHLRLHNLQLHIDNPVLRNPELFSRRDHISRVIGGDPTTTVATTTPRPDAPIHTTGYLAVKPRWNFDAPNGAGRRGTIVHLLSTLTDPVSRTQANFPVFVARGSHQWEYCGQYVVAEVEEMSTWESWMHLVEDGSGILDYWVCRILRKKHEWAKTLFMNNGGWTEEQWNNASGDDLKRCILEKKVPMHFIHLQCVGFEMKLYEALVKEKNEGISVTNILQHDIAVLSPFAASGTS